MKKIFTHFTMTSLAFAILIISCEKSENKYDACQDRVRNNDVMAAERANVKVIKIQQDLDDGKITEHERDSLYGVVMEETEKDKEEFAAEQNCEQYK